MSLKIKGMDKLLKKLARLEKGGARRAMRKATVAGTTVLRTAVRAAVPVDEGLLKKATSSRVSGKGNRMTGRVGADVAKLKSANASDSSRPTNIDHLVEFGHVGPDGSFVPPSGYMRQSSAAAMPAAEAKYVSKLAEEIEREAMK